MKTFDRWRVNFLIALINELYSICCKKIFLSVKDKPLNLSWLPVDWIPAVRIWCKLLDSVARQRHSGHTPMLYVLNTWETANA